MAESLELSVSVPGLRAFRETRSQLVTSVKEFYAVGRLERGRSSFWGRGKVWRSEPGSILVKEPGDVHRDIAHDGSITFTAVTLPTAEIERARETGKVISKPHFEAGDERSAPFHRLHDAVISGADRLSLEVALTEAVTAFARLGDARPDQTRPVRRAVEFLRENLADAVTLDDLASHAELDKFHLCRAFRTQIGFPPHAYLTHLRIHRAKALLRAGIRPSELAPRVGLYDQSQLTRHFRRIVGVTPARYGGTRSARGFAV
ncbi:MAG: helix-turn-helix transcriptional regulator [Polyangiaceae bacterium]|nr:helix-turn-helix transcriptional regulator [Polyangiaceae bacterium]